MALKLDERPIFIIGSERSGTTLIMAVLGTHPRLAVPEVAWYYPRFRPYLFTYGDLGEIENFRTLVHEMAHGLRTPYWGMKVNPAAFGDEIVTSAVDIEQSFAGVYAAMFERYARETGKPRWGEKTPYNLFYVGEILEDFPDAQFVFIYRDGRDVCAEFLDAAFGPTNIYSASELWKMGQDAAKPWRNRLSGDQWLDVRYEDFVRDPAGGLKKICAFLGEDFAGEMLDFHTTETARRRGRTRDNRALAEPISEKHVGIYRELLSIRDQRILSWVAGETLEEYGYEDVLEPLALDEKERAFMDEMDGRCRAAALDAPGGWIVMESYNDWLMDQREARRQAGLWTDIPEPAPFPIGQKFEEYLSGMRAERRWKDHFSIKREYSRTKAVL
ncbi:MAG: sulfotransferase [Gammaproteobacteria bacterium]|nr:sulfotransferase [Gammaproteobacteria bacterium]